MEINENSLIDLPAEIRSDIASISENDGVLSAKRCKRVCEQLSIEIEALMVGLLPIAASYSKSPISSFKVGAVAKGADQYADGFANLYLGANFEFEKQALCHSVHAEQSAVSNAWSHDEPTVNAIATSAAPCGHCRQFLYEVAGKRPFPILLPLANVADVFSAQLVQIQAPDSCTKQNKAASPKNFNSIDLAELLPAAFGPLDLGCERLLMEQSFGSNHLNLGNDNQDELILRALKAADLCYAPYTLNFVGCAVELTSGEIFTGRYAENVAHNPSLSAFSAALCSMMMNNIENVPADIKRVVMVERPTKSCQKNITEVLLSAYNKEVKLEYYKV